MPNVPILAFNAGLLSSQIDARSDVDKYSRGCRYLDNMIPRIYGGAERRPGNQYIYDATNTPVSIANTVVRMVEFVYSGSIAYMLEFGNRYIRVFFNGAILEDADSAEVWISSPYLAADLLELQFKQRADTMWIVHPSYPQMKLTRTDVYTFELNEIDFRKGPFLVRNDLVNPDNPSTTTLACTTTSAGSSGILEASVSLFLPGHKGALFMLIHSISTTIIQQNGVGTSDELSVKGDYNFGTHGRWTGTVKLQRNENNSVWEDFKTYIGENDKNVQLAGTESEDNVKYRITIESATTCKADLTVNNVEKKGVVKVTAILNPFKAAVEVYSDLESTDATKKWHEGAWSYARGFPGTVTFYNDRCVYSGASRPLEDDEFGTSQYPSLIV